MNARVRYASGAIVSVAALSFLAFEMQSSPRESRPSEATALTARGVERRGADESDVSRLKAEVASLETRIAAIQSGLADSAAADSAAADSAAADAERAEVSAEALSADPAVALTPEESRAQSDASWQAHMAQVAAAFDDEPVEKDWAAEKKELVQSRLQDSPILSAAAGGIECRSRSCRIELTGNHTDVNREIAMFVHQLGTAMPRAQAERIDEEDGRVTMVLYVGERGGEPSGSRGSQGSD